jgi:uncharacterized coiled-coil DUF342 family protein
VTCWGGLTHERPSRRPARSYRRSALLLVAREAGAAKAQELDGKLIALCREFEDAEVTFAAWDAERDSCRSTIRAKEIDTLERALVNRRHEIREEVAELKAHTPEGLQAKARMVMTELAEARRSQQGVLQPAVSRGGLSRS